MVAGKLARAGLLLALLAPVWAIALTAPSLPAFLEPFFQAIRTQESRGHPWSIFNNTTRQSFRLPSRAEAEQAARQMIDRGHNIDVGLYQLNWRYQGTRPGVTLDNVFDPSVNEAVARQVLLEFFNAARARFADLNDAIRMAVGAYNNGRVTIDNPRYVNAVYRLAGQPAPYSAEEGRPGPVATTATGAPPPAGGLHDPAVPLRGGGWRTWFGSDQASDSEAEAQDQADAASSAGAIGAALLTFLLWVFFALLLLLIVVFAAKLLIAAVGKWAAARIASWALRSAASAVNSRTQRATGIK